jgi:hypothetical protein
MKSAREIVDPEIELAVLPASSPHERGGMRGSVHVASLIRAALAATPMGNYFILTLGDGTTAHHDDLRTRHWTKNPRDNK